MKQKRTKKKELSPFRIFGDMERKMGRMMDNFLKSPEEQEENDFHPLCKVSEKVGHYMINCDLPGVPKDDIHIDLSEGKVHIYGEKKSNFEGDSTINLKFERIMSLPENVGIDDAEAIFKNGVLSIALKMTGKTKIKRLDIGTKKSSHLSSLFFENVKKKSVKESNADKNGYIKEF